MAELTDYSSITAQAGYNFDWKAIQFGIRYRTDNSFAAEGKYGWIGARGAYNPTTAEWSAAGGLAIHPQI